MVKLLRFILVRVISRNSSAPHLSGDLFKSLTDFEFEENSNNTLTPPSAIIFTNSLKMELLQKSQALETNRLTILAGNSDRDFDKNFDFSAIECDRIYVQNLLVPADEKIKVLPLGIENLRIGRNGIPLLFFRFFYRFPKRNKVLLGPISQTHNERIGLMEEFSKNENVVCLTKFMNPLRYAFKSSRFKFIACPRGNGVDTHRFWESLYRGGIPIVVRSAWSQNIRSLGIPLIEIESWSNGEINRVLASSTPNFDPGNIPALWEDYWKKEFKKS